MPCSRTTCTPCSTIRVLRSGTLALALSALVLTVSPAAAVITADPQALYLMMRRSYDSGIAKGWPFAAEVAYLSTVLDAGRAYSLFRPTDPQYGEVAGLTVDVASEMHYDPLNSDDAALWYVREAAAWVQAHGDAPSASKAAALLARLNTAEDPAALAGQAEADAAANVHAFHGEPAALVAEVVAEVRAFALTHDPTYRSLMLAHAAEPAVTLAQIPVAERGQLFTIVSATLADPGAAEIDRANARAIVARRNRTSAARLATDPKSEPRAVVLTHTAPADEYFGEIRISPVGIQDEMQRISKYLDAGWGDRMAPDALRLSTAVQDWQHQYPHDRTLPKYLAGLYRLLLRVDAPATVLEAQRIREVLVIEYAGSNEARQLDAS